MVSSMVPDSGKPRYDVSNDVGLKEIMQRLRGYFGCGVEFADVLTKLQSRYRPPSTITKDNPVSVAFESRPFETERERTANQLRCRLQMSERVAKAISCSSLVASLFAATVFLLEIAHIVQLIHDW